VRWRRTGREKREATICDKLVIFLVGCPKESMESVADSKRKDPGFQWRGKRRSGIYGGFLMLGMEHSRMAVKGEEKLFRFELA
jgi:hypothetical protein